MNTAKELYEINKDFQIFMQIWEEIRTCPFPVIDLLIEEGLNSQADCAKWCDNMPERRVFLPTALEKPTPCKPYPSTGGLKLKWYWNINSGFNDYAYGIPKSALIPEKINLYMIYNSSVIYYDSPKFALIGLMDCWKGE